MSTRRFRLTKTAKILIMVLIIALVGGGVFAGVKTGFIKTSDGSSKNETVATNDKNEAITNNNNNNNVDIDESGNVINTDKDTDGTINISLDEWIG